jgi:hypothetical protein
VLLVLSVLSFAAGVAYAALPAKSLPGFMPGHEVGQHLHVLPGAIFGLIAAFTFLVLAATSLPRTPPADQPLLLTPRLGRPPEEP